MSAPADRGLGRRFAPDPRDWPMRTAAPAPAAPPRTTRFYQCGPVLDQGPYPTCVGHAWRQWLSSALLMTRDGPDPAAIYRAAQEVDEWPGTDYDGTSVRAGAKVLQARGHIGAYVWGWRAEDVRTWLLSNRGTVVLGTVWTQAMFEVNEHGFITPAGRAVGGHAYLCVGASDDRQAVRILNSWGHAWGEHGRAWLSYDDLDRLLTQNGEACMATEERLPSAEGVR